MTLTLQYIAGWIRGHQDLTALLLTIVAMALFAIVAIIVHRSPAHRIVPNPPAATVVPEPPAAVDLTAGAPRLLIRYTSKEGGKITFINDGPGSVVNLRLGPLAWQASRRLRIEGSVGVLLQRATCEKEILIETSPGNWSECCDYLRGSTPSDAQHRVAVTYEDSQGTRFARDFLLTTEIDGTIEWKPGPVELRERCLRAKTMPLA